MSEPLEPGQVKEIFLATNALRSGHFLLSSGRHSNEYWEKFWVLQHPRYVQTLCAEIARRYADDRVEVVLGPTTGGIILAFEVARQMGVQALYAEKENGVRCLRRDFTLAPGTRTLIVDDIMTTGGATRECLELAQRHQADVVGVSVLVDRSGGTVDLGCRLEPLLTVQATTYDPQTCPLCAEGIPIHEPGTTRKS
jgi:orotate phosphoribosyltransferase